MKFTTISKAKKETGFSYLGSINSSSKLLKSGIVSKQYTYGLYLAPAKTSGYNVCSHSTKECRLGCLATSGRAGMELISGGDRIKNARIKKTKLFYEQPEFFMQWLIAEIRVAQLKAKKDGYFFSVRLNGTSDIDWQNVRINGQNIFEIFPEVSFYDYTKNVMKFFNLAPNYHLTLSYTGRNWHLCEVMLKNGHNVAMVFNVKNEKQLPLQFADYQVINGDLTDYRVADAKGIIVGLKWKRIADRVIEKQVLNSVFVVQPNDVRCSYNNVQINELELV
jgi:hypothetical protein